MSLYRFGPWRRLQNRHCLAVRLAARVPDLDMDPPRQRSPHARNAEAQASLVGRNRLPGRVVIDAQVEIAFDAAVDLDLEVAHWQVHAPGNTGRIRS